MLLQKTDAGATTSGNTENEIAEQMAALGLTNEEDLSLRVSMYSVVLQIYTDLVRQKVTINAAHYIIITKERLAGWVESGRGCNVGDAQISSQVS